MPLVPDRDNTISLARDGSYRFTEAPPGFAKCLIFLQDIHLLMLCKPLY